MYIAKMHTRYPDFHGSGYYNFIIEEYKTILDEKIERNSHDFSLEGTVKTRYKTLDSILKKYPTKESLNDRYFK